MTTTETGARSLKDVLATPRRALMNDPRFDWARPRKVRRRLVLVQLALSAVACSAVAGMAAIGATAAIAALLVLIVPMIVTIGSLNASVRGLAELRSSDLDEWQIKRRDAVYRACWWPALTLMTAAGFAAAFAPVGIGPKAAAMLFAYLVTIALPPSVLAWTLPDEPDAES